MSFQSLLIHSCYIAPPASSQNTLGEWKFSWTYSTTATDCRMSPISDSERISSPGRFDNVSYRAFFMPDITIDLEYRLKYNNEYYRIIDVRLDSSSHHYSALVSKI
jgi:hypothetical protein